MQVTFRTVDAEIETLGVSNDDDKRQMEIVEITFHDGKVSAFPADAVNPETGRRYCDLYSGKYRAFKNGEPDPERVEQLEREIAERKAELDAIRRPKSDALKRDSPANTGTKASTAKNKARA